MISLWYALNSVVNWIMFARYHGEYNGFHDSTFLMLIYSGAVSFACIIYKKREFIYGLKWYKAVIVILLIAGLSVPFALYLEEGLFNPVWIFANVYFDSTSLNHFEIIWNGNMLAWRSFLEMCGIVSLCGVIAFRKEMKFKIWYWLPYLAVVIVWLFGFHLVASLPLPDGYGFYEHASYVANGFEIVEVLTFCVGYSLCFLNGIKISYFVKRLVTRK